MTTKSKAKGSRWERDSVLFLSRWWPKVEKRAQAGRFDKGDILNGPRDFTLENKDTAKVDIPGQLREAEAERGNTGTRFYALLRKQRRGKLESGSTGRGLFIMRFEDACRLLIEYERMADMMRWSGIADEKWQEPE